MGLNIKLIVGAAVIIAVIAYIAMLSQSTSLQYYLLVDECAAQRDTLQGKRLRISGGIAADSLRIAEDRRSASFVLQGKEHRLAVHCRGTLPDNLAEGIEVVVEGSLNPDGQLDGDRVITRCASKYAPEGAASETNERSKYRAGG